MLDSIIGAEDLIICPVILQNVRNTNRFFLFLLHQP